MAVQGGDILNNPPRPSAGRLGEAAERAGAAGTVSGRSRGGTITLDPSRGRSVSFLVAEAPDRSGGVGGWQTSERPFVRPAHWYKAPEEDTMTLSLVIDFDELPGDDVEDRLMRLREMGTADADDDPPTIRIRGDVWDYDRTVRWVMQGLSLGERLYRRNGKIRRQAVSVDLVRGQPVQEIDGVRVRRTRRGVKKHRKRVVRARQHDTLRSIALRELGDPTRWKDIRGWNKKALRRVDPDARLRVGTRLVLH